ncbi:hypothetical protein, unknown function [Leishmania mexicana MHOM/GT/2001/U1103]|uniref:Uncharacterized protein n=1 Tax=Leishmania mexicana (strain MHOM/GT/2001/U1103) TaxID=929439 RepID=E9AL01_LEIMU|nr:hypothetical protein, unknown function [Leishmania mexicana MHOM/GT/2001/U1103]CBZ23604.1 hypothetical protein, unknown function [Leishmania mexicana MHOM/GT/2001/U1103]
MKLFLTVVGRRNSTRSSDAAPTDDVVLFDPGVWSRTAASEMARWNVSASYVARQVYRHAALMQLAKVASEGAVCFRYGPRPPPHLDSFLFHKRSRVTGHGRGGTPPPPAAAAAAVCTPSPLISSSGSFSSVSMATTSPRTGQTRSTAAGASGSATEYDSLLALWLRELLSGTGGSVTVTALLLFVGGTAIDMATGSEVHTPLSVGSGTARQLRTHEDAMVFLHACESTIHHSSAEFPRCPYHVCVAVHAGAHGGSHGRSAVTFLDVAAAAPESAGAYDEVRLREQVALFGRQLGAEATTAMPHARPRTRKASDEHWLSLLQSCQLSRASLVGLVYIACEASHDPFGHSRVENDCDPFTLATALRQRALLEAVNNGVLHPHLRKPSHAQKRATAQPVKPPTSDATTTSRAPDSPPKGRSSRGRQRQQQHSPRLPYLTRGSVPPRRAQEHSIACCGFPRCGRSADPLGRIGREEHHARVALSSAEQRARRLAELGWILRSHPPGKSIDAMLQRLTHNVDRVSRPKQQQPHPVPPRSLPPPLTKAQLATAMSLPSTTATRRSSFTSPTRTPESASPDGPVQRRVTVSILSTSPSCVALESPFTRHITTPPILSEVGSPPQNEGDPRAHSVSSPAAVRGPTAAEVERRCLRSGASFSLARDSPKAHTCTSARRFSAIETALLARARSSQRSLPSHSPRRGDVERLYPLVHAFHVEMCEQDALMAEELMVRSRIEHKERNCRKTLSVARTDSARRPSVLWLSETGTQQQQPDPQAPLSNRWRSAHPRPLRIFFEQ